jgi:hypothetical protein
MTSEEYFYLLTSLDGHTVDMENYKYGGTNFTTFRGAIHKLLRIILNSDS